MAAETGILSGIAGRYATALFDLAKEARALDAVAADLDRLQALIEQSPELRRLVHSPVFSREQQGRAMAAILERGGFGDLLRRFVGVAAENRRLFVLDNIIRAFRGLLAQHRGETVARVVSATPLSEPQLQQLKTALREAVGREVSIDGRVDPALIGGLTVKLGSRMVDASIRSKLQALKNAMKGVA